MSLVLYVFPGDCVISSVNTPSYVTLNLDHHHVFGEAPTIFLILRARADIPTTPQEPII